MDKAQWISVRILQKRLEADDIVSLILQTQDGESLPAFDAGAHIDLELKPGLVRQYSLCNSAEDGTAYEIAVLRDPRSRGGSKAVHAALQVGELVRISAPRNHFALDSLANKFLLFAGGIGVTPIMCMAEELSAAGKEFEMHYCARSQDKAAYLKRLSSAALADKVSVHFDDGAPEQRLKLEEVLASPVSGTHLYVCGPAGFIDAVLSSARNQGWLEDQLHREFFSAPVVEGENESFSVVLARSGKTIEVPADKSIVEALDEEGFFIPTSCCEGICGMCMVNVLEGEPDHRDGLLTEAEKAKNDRLAACVSRAKSKTLVLEL